MSIVYVKRFCENSIPLITFLVFCIVLCFVYFIRPPVIFVTDIYFAAIYGENFERIRRLEASFKLVSAVKIIRIVADTDNLSIAESVKKVSKAPRAVFFPYAYAEAAELYTSILAENPRTKTRVFILRDRAQLKAAPPENSFLYYVQDAPDIDLYRAGACAAVLTRDNAETAVEEDAPRKSVVFVHDMDISDAEKQSFAEGLQSIGFSGRPDFINGYTSRNWNNVAAVILQGASPAFIQSYSSAPVILFSWFSNINFTPNNVRIMVDDSPYYLIPEALKAVKTAAGDRLFTIPSRFIIFPRRITNKALIPELKKVIMLNR